MATSILTISTKHENIQIFESLKVDLNTDLSKIIVALIKYCRNRLDKRDRKFKIKLEQIIKNG